MTIQRTTYLSYLFLLLLAACGPAAPYTDEIAATLPETVSYNFHIRPILADRCFSCHGPDEAARKGELRLDEAARAYAKGSSGRSAVHGGSLGRSEVFHRIYSEDAELQMPPPESNLSLDEREKALISRWIEQGGIYEPHWSFVPVEKPPVPDLTSDAVKNPIDQFILAKLQPKGLDLAPAADRERLIRRLSFDLTGLPPTLEQIDAFLADDSPAAYEKLVDRLLAGDAYAERMALDWMDLARYADSQGLHSDGWRSMYPWRDWVIDAYREGMPFDQFLTWQLAGDLLPKPSREQLIATGFNRNHKTTAEGGVVDEEYRAEYVHDRVATTATAFMGLTMECARCHDHKYDPITQKEYYRFYAFFNQVDELGLSGDDGNAGPNMLLPAPETEARIREISKEIHAKALSVDHAEADLAKEKDFISNLPAVSMAAAAPPDIALPLDDLKEERIDRNAESRVSGEAAIVETDRGKVLELDAEYEFIDLPDQGLFEQYDAFSGAIWIRPLEKRTSQTIMGNSGQKGTFWRGWDLILDSLNHLNLRLIHALPHDVLSVRSEPVVPTGAWTHVAFTYDGSGRAAGVQLYLNGEAVAMVTEYDLLQRSIYPIAFSKARTDRSLRLGKSYRAFTGEYGIYAGQLDDFKLFSRRLSPLEVAALTGALDPMELFAEFRKQPEPEQRAALTRTWWYNHPPAPVEELRALRREKQELLDTVPEVMIIRELDQPRKTYVLNRGNYDEPTVEVTPGTPASLLPFPDSLPANRLGLARWLTDPRHPLTSRVVVNRLWQQFFGRGLVDTPHDLGLQGSLPSHPELLDWLAASLLENGWEIRAIQKLIVLSATYRQSSVADPALREKDPDNRLWARAPSYRLPGEMIRDNALLASGLLNRKVGGPSVRPVQPAGLWTEKTSSTHILRKYETDSGTDRYRRSLYTFIRRTSPHPAMTAFDVPNRSVCTAERQRTNTPMQALVLLNDPQFVEASRVLAERVLDQETELAPRISLAFRLLTGREPRPLQLRELVALQEEEQARFSEATDAARDYVLTGQFPPADHRDPVELAAMTVVVNTIMNFDEFYTKR
ncbi:DUF1553 domain-containing protein [Flavilitoribacter nigricans]|uniref:LamG-like jellyroll fold domain-containing protein n=1 Tax=Flavilitoribacter nigricans (strain ATCC 23147 / DSM 23189 / NBRC 102662 / NCIMB 1420 / SS-2) TaxID=1122177 RepID=A0A2D0NHY2_FLAN2|nr:DUF1553 domain-containing protein [Flavilitoribacter nigricans]PHN08112.1 hypothetical protein CRP01_01970 [Flavilitoribacter nigricans DSM 23189 = NBRC 102662]